MFKKNRVALGKGHLDRWTIFEFKKFFSLYVHRFNTIEQDRFHTHAFHGIAIVLYGWYREEYKPEAWMAPSMWTIRRGIRFIPRGWNHRLLNSKPNTISILFAGPWADQWTETKDGIIRTLGWGRKVISEHPAEFSSPD